MISQDGRIDYSEFVSMMKDSGFNKGVQETVPVNVGGGNKKAKMRFF